MTLFWCLVVSLVLVGLALRREVRKALEGLRLHFFGVPVRVPAPQAPEPRRRRAPSSGYGFLPPPGVSTRAGGLPRDGHAPTRES